jgi:serine-type D-Ala-D-Ala carboxypeptidase/endopeptidase (penicillin-binding protein 4)
VAIHRFVILAVAIASAVTAGPAAAREAAPLQTRLARALTVPGVSWNATGAIAVELSTREVVFTRNARLSLRPASNEKLAVALAALDELGPAYRLPTRVFGEGRLDGRVWRGRLVLKGYGDPTLSRSDLVTLAREVEARGIARVTGGVVGDESHFDARRTAPGWKPSYYKLECPPLSALVVARGRLFGRIVDAPARAAAEMLRRALRAEGVRIGRATGSGVAAPTAALLADVYSPPVARIVRVMNVESDNFYAEMLLKELGAHELRRGTTSAGARVVRSALAARGVPLAGVRIADGSGLSRGDRLTAQALAALLISARDDPRLGWPFYSSLPVAGVNGTLDDRMTRGPAFRRVRAKTGTTSIASALSGYVTTRYVFAILQNGYPIPWWYARRGQDRFAQILAAQPQARPGPAVAPGR